MLLSLVSRTRVGRGPCRCGLADAVFKELMRSMLRFIILFAPVALAACTSFDAGPPPMPRAEIVSAPVAAQPVVPANIRPLTEDQRAMLDG